MRSSLALCAGLLAAFVLGACGGGGDDGPTPEAEVKRAAVRAIENDDPGTLCHRQLSKAYLTRVYEGDLDKCIEAVESSAEEPGKAKATKALVRPDETHAVVTVEITGGSLDGSAGRLEMVKEGTWKVDDYADDFVRSTFLAAIRTNDEGLVSTPEMKACFTRQVSRLPADKIRRLTYASNADEEKEVRQALLRLAENCPESALAEYGARTFTEGLVNHGNHKPGYVKCLRKEFKFLLEITGITSELLVEHPNFAAVSALEGIAEGAKKNCGG